MTVGKSRSKNHRTILIFISLLITQLCLFLFLTLRPFWITPPGRIYIGLGTDSLAVNLIRQSKDGGFRMTNAFTTTPTPPTIGNLFYILIGKIAYVTNIDPVLIYQMTRIIGGMALFGATYWFITLLLPASLHLVALLFTLIVETGPLSTDFLVKPLNLWTPAWATQTMLMRNFGPPLLVWAQVFALALLCFILLSIRKPKIIYIPYILLLGFMATVTLPSYGVTLVVCLLVPWLMYAVITKRVQKTLPPIFLAIIVIVASAVWINTVFAHSSLWDLFAREEQSWLPSGPIFISFIQVSCFIFRLFLHWYSASRRLGGAGLWLHGKQLYS